MLLISFARLGRGCGRQNKGPPKDAQALIPRICEYARLEGKVGVKVANQPNLGWGDYPGLSR